MKCALVTGGSRGIGKAICVRLSASGYHVIVNYHSNITEAENTLELIRSNGGSGELLQFDVANGVEVEKAIDSWKANNKESIIEVLVNNAGIRQDALMMWMEDSTWNNVLNTNLNSFFYVTKQLIKEMMVNKFGRVINIVSLSGIKGMPGQVNYSAAKAGVIGATKALAQEVGKKNVTINAIAPGFIKTDMTADMNEKELKNLIPMNRFGEAEEVADLVAFLASKKASYITGEVISINGGLYT
ncbi:MAG: beta-ketoacyl-ACP reductase [Bacteroidetes bacterium GWA2_31_9]|nr:MAG: beta-ketoacyl-ACP reductase [Bacteroidetes bacterium GWA2_31_9]